MKAHIFRELVNDLRDIATQWHGSQQLRERISRRLHQDVSIDEDPANDGWMLVETAPKDKFVLLCGPSGYTTTPLVFTTGIMRSNYHAGRWIDHANNDLVDWDLSLRTGCRFQHRLKVSLPLWQHTGSKLR